jgi:hypothetical protein
MQCAPKFGVRANDLSSTSTPYQRRMVRTGHAASVITRWRLVLNQHREIPDSLVKFFRERAEYLLDESNEARSFHLSTPQSQVLLYRNLKACQSIR